MTSLIAMPTISEEAEAEAVPVRTLGLGSTAIRSTITIGRSDVLPIGPDDIEDDALRAYLSSLEGLSVLTRITLRLSFRPRGDEVFERALFTVALSATDATAAEQPIARLLAPQRLVSGPYTIRKGLTLGVSPGVPGAQLNLHGDWARETEVQPCFVIGRGEGESDAEWDYQRTATMRLDGSHEMALVAESRHNSSPEVQLRVEGTVRSGLRHCDAEWPAPSHIASFSLHPAT